MAKLLKGRCETCGHRAVVFPDALDLDAPVLCGRCGANHGSWRTYERRGCAGEPAAGRSQRSRPSSDLRSADRIRCLLRGRIVFNARSATVECTIRDISETGAKLCVTRSVTIPDIFELEFPKTGKRRRAQQVWTKQNRVGVRFVA